MAQLYGSCVCERNQYTVIVPSDLTALAQVFFDNSLESRRTQATPVAAWLRIPLDWYHSTTYALYPDESHTTIKRTFHTRSPNPTLPPVRRQFCGYCGTHLTAWSEADRAAADHLDVTLGSLLGESIDQLEALNIIPSAEMAGEEQLESYEEEAAERAPDGGDKYAGEYTKGAVINDEEHIDEDPIPTRDRPAVEGMGGLEGSGAAARGQPLVRTSTATSLASRQMRNRGLPYFEEMVEHSRLGRIKRQKGGHTSDDGRTTVQWEVVELDNTDPTAFETADVAAIEAAGTASTGRERPKRQKTGA